MMLNVSALSTLTKCWSVILMFSPITLGKLFFAAETEGSSHRHELNFTPRHGGQTVYFMAGIVPGSYFVVPFLTDLDQSSLAKVELQPTIPLLNMDDLEEATVSIFCSQSTMTVRFREAAFFENALSTWLSIDAFAVLTSIPGCQKIGEHGIWRWVGVEQYTSRTDRLQY